MERWHKICLILCCYGFFKELRPSEPFLNEYLTGPQHQLTQEEVNIMVYPVWTYSYLSLLVAVFLFTDLLRYKPVIVFESVGYVSTWCLLLWARGVRWMQLVEFTYGIATSTEVAYFTYIYAQVDAKYYQKVTSYTRTAFLTGRFASGALAQLLTSSGLMDYYTLNYFTLTSELVAFIIAIFLPSVAGSIYFHRDKSSIHSQRNTTQKEDYRIETDGPYQNEGSGALTHREKEEEKDKPKPHRVLSAYNIKKVAYYLWDDFKTSYKNMYLLKWSIWWAFATCINYQIGNYIQVLWKDVAVANGSAAAYNGIAEASSTLLGAITVFGTGYVRLNWNLLGEMVLAIISLFDGVLLLLMGTTSSLWLAYVGYVAFRVSYAVLITIASYQVAKVLKAECYGLVFGVNMFVSLAIQSILTLIVIAKLEMGAEQQFVVYGGYMIVLGIAFFIIASYSLAKLGCAQIKETSFWESTETSVDDQDDKTTAESPRV